MQREELHQLLPRRILWRAKAEAGFVGIPPAFGVRVAMVFVGAFRQHAKQANRLEVVAENVVATAVEIEWFHDG